MLRFVFVPGMNGGEMTDQWVAVCTRRSVLGENGGWTNPPAQKLLFIIQRIMRLKPVAVFCIMRNKCQASHEFNLDGFFLSPDHFNVPCEFFMQSLFFFSHWIFFPPVLLLQRGNNTITDADVFITLESLCSRKAAVSNLIVRALLPFLLLCCVSRLETHFALLFFCEKCYIIAKERNSWATERCSGSKVANN